MPDNALAPLPLTIPGLPTPCCLDGRTLMTTWVDTYSAAVNSGEAAREVYDAELAWTTHQLVVHRLNPPRVTGCHNCAEWAANLELGPDDSPDLDHPVQYEAAEHAVRHQVFDPLVRHFSGGRRSAF
ncbi:hypothetical protein AB0I86_33230 [Streptomyces sp. NPDC049950]|uniref:hypothetical protein n=1 Tax=Streptomyces sp. NPDC049950 TaxID=3156659 RepID=UPI003443BC78